MSRRQTRLMHEMRNLAHEPPFGIHVTPHSDQLGRFQVQMTGPKDSPYEGAVFNLAVLCSDQYPIEPPGIFP